MMPFAATLDDNVTRYADAPCWLYKHDGRWTVVSWRDAQRRWMQLGAWLADQQVPTGSAVAIWASTRIEWTIADVASILAGLVVVPVYHNLPLDQAQFIIHEPNCSVLVLEKPLSATGLQQLLQACPALRVIIGLWDEPQAMPAPSGAVRVVTWQQVMTAPVSGADALAARSRALRDDALVSIVYTSGTTGVPKGAELTLGNFVSEVNALAPVFEFPQGSRCLQFLPLAHIVARAVQFFLLLHGHVGVYAESIDAIGANLRETSPHFFVGVPRIFEKMQAKLEAGVRALPPWKQRLFRWAMVAGDRRSRAAQQQRRLAWIDRCRWAVARLVFRPMHRQLGGALVCAVSGGAPLAGSVARFFHSCGILILEGYGLTETTAAVAINRPRAFHFGTVGAPLPPAQLRLADDGEILVAGPTVFRGYFQRPEETAAVLRDGWFYTGDIGEWARDGSLRITDRKKDLLKTAGGKYAAPQPIENALKQHAWIADAMVYGESRPYLTAVVILERAAVESWAQQMLGRAPEWPALLHEPRVLQHVQQSVERVNIGLASYETIKRFRIIVAPFSVDGGELTPTLKIRRKVVAEKYRALFDEMYGEGAAVGGVYDQHQHAA